MQGVSTVTALSSCNLAEISQTVPIPQYDRRQVSVGIVHFGVGGFHRAHQAMFVDRLMNDGLDQDWGICGVGLLPQDARMRDVLESQDGLYTLVLKDAAGIWEPRVIGSIVEYLFAPDDPHAVLDRLCDPATRIVSLTITEGGYNFDQSSGEFVASHPDIWRDLQPGAAPGTVFGFVVTALRRRREEGIRPFVVMSCDNILENGNVAKRSFVSFAELADPDFAEWMKREVRFPNSMVDRITPVTTAADRAGVRSRWGVEDSWPVIAEPFAQWVLEDDFDGVRPHYEKSAVQLVRDVSAYELMKLRLLNVGHQALAYFGYLMGYRFAHEAAQDPLVREFLARYMELEAMPTLQPVPGIDLQEYQRSLLQRFSNAEVRDTIARLCSDTSDRIPKWLVPVIREQLDAHRSTRYSAAVVASWARYAEGTDEQGDPIDVVDNLRAERMEAARAQRSDPAAFLHNGSLFGRLAQDPDFMRDYLWCLESLHAVGARRTLELLVAEPG